MEVSNDNILFGMPESPEMFLAALSTVQDFAKQLSAQVRMGRKLSGWFLAAHVPNRELDFLKPCFPEEMAFLDEWEPKRGEWDYCYRFDEEASYRLSIPTEQHVTTCFGIMVGADPAQLPDLSAVKYELDSPKAPLLRLMDFEGRDELAEIIDRHRPELGLTNCGTEIVVGMRSFETYVAAALGKTVLELYPDDRHMKWLSKWTGKYQMVYGDRFPVEYTWRALEGLLERYPIYVQQT